MSTADILFAFQLGRPVSLIGPAGHTYKGQISGVQLESGFKPPRTATQLLITIEGRTFYYRTTV